MTQPRSFPSSILVGVELPDAAPLSSSLVDLLASLRVVLVGWYAVPDQTLPDQAREQFEEEAEKALESITAPFKEVGGELDTFLVFTHDAYETMSRVSTEQGCDAVLLPAKMEHLRRVLVPLRGLHNAPYIARFLADLVQDGTTDVTLLHVHDEDETAQDTTADDLLDRASSILVEQGIDAGRIHQRTVASDDPAETILNFTDTHEVLVIGETEPSVKEMLFGSVSETVIQNADIPVIVVRNSEGAISDVGEPDVGELSDGSTQ